jgi:subtilisin family serine protease
MLRVLILLLYLQFFIGCGGSSADGKSSASSTTSSGSDLYSTQQWSIYKNDTLYNNLNVDDDAHIHVSNLLSTYTGRGVKIAVIDDGLDVNHEDLVGAVVDSFDINTLSSDVSHTGFSGYHGTAVTGIIGARSNSIGIKGIASQADIIFLKYNDFMTDAQTIELFNKAEEFGADIINNSWGTSNVSDAVKDKIVDLSQNGRGGKGTIIVFASGNSGADMGNDEAAIPEVIAVGATNKNNVLTSYSSFGATLDVVAPGGDVLGITTLDPTGIRGAGTLQEDYLLYNDSNSFIGTSAAAPIVSGVIALMLQKNPDLTLSQINTILQDSSDKIGTTPYVAGRNDYYGYGKINLSKIMNLVN